MQLSQDPEPDMALLYHLSTRAILQSITSFIPTKCKKILCAFSWNKRSDCLRWYVYVTMRSEAYHHISTLNQTTTAHETDDNNTSSPVGKWCASKTLHKSLKNLLNLNQEHLQQYPKGSSAWNMPHCAEVPQSSVIMHSVFSGFTNITSIFHPSLDDDDDDYDDNHNNSNC